MVAFCHFAGRDVFSVMQIKILVEECVGYTHCEISQSKASLIALANEF